MPVKAGEFASLTDTASPLTSWTPGLGEVMESKARV